MGGRGILWDNTVGGDWGGRYRWGDGRHTAGEYRRGNWGRYRWGDGAFASVEDTTPLCQWSSKCLQDNWHSGLLSSTKHRLSGRRSPDCRRVNHVRPTGSRTLDSFLFDSKWRSLRTRLGRTGACDSKNNQSKSSKSHTRAQEKPHPSTTPHGQQTLRREATQAWGAKSESRKS